MNRFDGTSARQLDLLDPQDTLRFDQSQGARAPRTHLRVLRKDVYAELARRRRRAQIAARHMLERD